MNAATGAARKASESRLAPDLRCVDRMMARLGTSPRILGHVATLCLLGFAACSMSGADSTGGRGPDSATGAGGTTGAGTGTATGNAGNGLGVPPDVVGGAGGGTDNLPPEREVESTYKAPVATGHFVWIANPTSGRVAYVDASSLAVKTVEAGNGPTYLAAVPGMDDAVVVLNTLSNDATLLTASGDAST